MDFKFGVSILEVIPVLRLSLAQVYGTRLFLAFVP